MWLRDALPLDAPGVRVLIYGYDARIIRSSSFQNLTDLGKALQIDIKGIRVSQLQTLDLGSLSPMTANSFPWSRKLINLVQYSLLATASEVLS